jgi:alpha-L-fucosidase
VRAARYSLGFWGATLAAALAFAPRAAAQNEAPGARAPRAAGEGFGMGPPATPEIVAAAVAATPALPPGPVQATWDSVRANYRVPEWFRDAKFGIFLHWGLYAVPAHGSEWYEKHMYGDRGTVQWHQEHFGPQDQFGYKDFIPRFTAAHWDPDAWAALFKRAGARYVVPTAEHHDGFSLWDSALNPWNSVRLGPKRDLIGELARAVRRAGLRFGVSNHSFEHYTFINPLPGLTTDLADPRYADFYWANHSDANLQRFFELWVEKNDELIDKHQPDLIYFDNGVNARVYDPLKLRVAAYYFNRAAAWGKQVAFATKDSAYLAGTIHDYERQQRAPVTLQAEVFQVDDSVFQRWGYLADAQYWNVEMIVDRLVENVCRNGNLLLNFAPKADGSIPPEQVNLLLGIGDWLAVNGEAIYGTRPWTRAGEGVLTLERGQHYTGRDIRFTTRGDTLYAILMAWPDGGEATVQSLGTGAGGVTKVELLGHAGDLEFAQDAQGLKVKLPVEQPGAYAFVLRIALTERP